VPQPLEPPLFVALLVARLVAALVAVTHLESVSSLLDKADSFECALLHLLPRPLLPQPLLPLPDVVFHVAPTLSLVARVVATTLIVVARCVAATLTVVVRRVAATLPFDATCLPSLVAPRFLTRHVFLVASCALS